MESVHGDDGEGVKNPDAHENSKSVWREREAPAPIGTGQAMPEPSLVGCGRSPPPPITFCVRDAPRPPLLPPVPMRRGTPRCTFSGGVWAEAKAYDSGVGEGVLEDAL